VKSRQQLSLLDIYQYLSLIKSLTEKEGMSLDEIQKFCSMDLRMILAYTLFDKDWEATYKKINDELHSE
jgi:DNA-binding transcriptional MerR regulator